jgi:hypothetical protein
MEVGGQLHTPAALPPEKELQASNGYEAGSAPKTVRTLWSRDKSLVSAGIETL